MFTLITNCAFGLESVLKKELKSLGYSDFTVENGRIEFQGTEKDIARCNLWLRTGDRVMIKVGNFKATTFDELFDATKSIPWEQYLTKDATMHVVGKSVDSMLHSVPACQSIVKKAMIERLKNAYKTSIFPESGALYRIEVAMHKDYATLTIDTSGDPLHRRGYRRSQGEAPLKETLAAGLILLCEWKCDQPLIDPFCGSGTIPIEAAMIAMNRAPGLSRQFASEYWPTISKSVWDDERQHAKSVINTSIPEISGGDIDGTILDAANENAFNAYAKQIQWKQSSFENYNYGDTPGFIVTNPPYGERIGDDVEKLYQDMGKKFRTLKGWSVNIISSYEEFERAFGMPAQKKRKLYNGNIKCYYYQYLI